MFNIILTKMREEIETWWNNTPFWLMENITGYCKDDFLPDDGYQDFVDACDEWWDSLNDSEKQRIYNGYY